jgi:hypothetical protein
MHVFAFSAPSHPDWRWRIVSYTGNILEESPDGFRTISAAVAHGTKRLGQLTADNDSESFPSSGHAPQSRMH